jgi:hypothetical protein
MILLIALLATSPLKASFGIGLGNAYDLAGVRLEVGSGPFSGTVGFGYTEVSHDWDHSVSFGARWSLLRDDDGLALAVHCSLFRWTTPAQADGAESLVIVSATIGWRWRFGPVYLEVGAGPAVTHDAYRFPSEDYGAASGTLSQQWKFGVNPGGITGDPFPIDAFAGLGFAL